MQHRSFRVASLGVVVAVTVAVSASLGLASPVLARVAPPAIIASDAGDASLEIPANAASAASAVSTPTDCPPAVEPMTADEIADAAKHAVDRGFLWRITKSGRTSWLYGTLHVGKRDWLVPGAKVTNALRTSDEVALEMDPLDPDITARLGAAMKSDDDDAPLPPELKERLAAQVRAACLPDSVASQMSPEMLAMSLSVVAGRRDGLEPAYGVDLTLATAAHQVHRPVRSLETPELQMSVIRGGGAVESRESIEQALDELESGVARTQLRRVADIWAESRFDELAHFADWCGCLDTDIERALMRRALDDRNPGLADGIAALHDSGHSVFAAVGSLHMIGPQGLPALLRQRGFTVERINLRP